MNEHKLLSVLQKAFKSNDIKIKTILGDSKPIQIEIIGCNGKLKIVAHKSDNGVSTPVLTTPPIKLTDFSKVADAIQGYFRGD